MKPTRNPFFAALCSSLAGKSHAPTGRLRKGNPGRHGSFRFCGLLSMSALALIGSPGIQAANTWDGGGADTNWDTPANWDNSDTLPLTTANVTFGTAFTSGTGVLLNGNRTVNSLTINSTTDFVLNNNTLTITNGDITRSAASGTTTIYSNIALGAAGAWDISGNLIANGIVSGGFTLTKSGAGTLTLANANSFSGGLTLSTGTLVLGDNAAAGTGTLTLAGGTIQGDGAARTIANNLSVTGNLTFSGSQDLIFTDAFDQVAARIYTVDNTTTFSGAITGGDALTKNGTGTMILSGAIANGTGLITVNAGTLQLGKTAGVNAVAGSLTIGDGTGTDTVQLAANNQISTSAVTINSSGVLDLNTFSDTIGNLTITGGGVTTGGGSLTIGTLAMTAGSVATGTGTLNLGGNVTGNANAASATISGKVDLGTAARTFTIADQTGLADDMAISAVISGTVGNGLIKAGAGTLTLSGANTYLGVTTINAGVLSVATLADGGLASNIGQSTNAAANLVLGGGTLLYTGATGSTNRSFTLSTGTTSVIEVSNALTNLTISGAGASTNGALDKTGAGTLTLSGANLFTGQTDVQAGTLAYGIHNALSSGAVTITGGTLDIGAFNDSVGAVTLTSGSIAGTTGVLTGTSYAVQSGSISAILGGGVVLTKTTGGTVTLSGANTYTGLTTVTAGTLAYGASNALAGGAVTVNGGILDIATFSDTVGTVTLTSGSITGTSGVLSSAGTFEMQSGSVSAILGGAVALNKTTAGTVTLSGANTNSGLTTVSAGELDLNTTGGQSIAGNLTVSAGIAKLLQADQINSSKNLVVSGTGTFNLQGFDQTVANAQLTSGSIIGSGGTLTSTNTYDLQAGSVSAILGGSVGANKTTAGTVTLTGANTFSGPLSIQQGILSIGTINNAGADGVLGNSANAVVLGGAATSGTLQYTGASATSDKAFDVANGNGVIQVDVAGTVLTLNGQVSQIGTGILTKTGLGTLTLGGAADNLGLGIIANNGTVVLGKTSSSGVHALGGAV